MSRVLIINNNDESLEYFKTKDLRDTIVIIGEDAWTKFRKWDVLITDENDPKFYRIATFNRDQDKNIFTGETEQNYKKAAQACAATRSHAPKWPDTADVIGDDWIHRMICWALHYKAPQHIAVAGVKQRVLKKHLEALSKAADARDCKLWSVHNNSSTLKLDGISFNEYNNL